jgi:hypothetical protein
VIKIKFTDDIGSVDIQVENAQDLQAAWWNVRDARRDVSERKRETFKEKHPVGYQFRRFCDSLWGACYDAKRAKAEAKKAPRPGFLDRIVRDQRRLFHWLEAVAEAREEMRCQSRAHREYIATQKRTRAIRKEQA